MVSSGSAAAAEYDRHSVIVKFRETPSVDSTATRTLDGINATIQDDDGDGIDDRFGHIAGGRLALVEFDDSENIDDVLAALRRRDDVDYVERNWIVQINADADSNIRTTPDDPRFDELYALHNTGQTGGTDDADIDASQAWDTTIGSSNIVVGVVDTGVDYTHEDIAANMWINPGEIPGNGVDDDGNGVVDDVHGFNALTGGGDPMDDNDHGTHCAGSIGAVGDNGTGITGVNWNVSIMALKFLSAGGSGSIAGAIAALDYAVDMKVNHGVDLRVLNNSWGGGGFSQALEDAISAANDADILFVAAAGGSASDNDSNPQYPSGYEVGNVLAVAASDHNDELASFSSFGANSVDLAAPGVNILSTIPGDDYASFSGSSMSTAYVSGAAALVLSVDDTLTVDELKDGLMTSVDPIPAFDGLLVTGGRLNVDAALPTDPPPDGSFSLSASPGSRRVTQGDSAEYTITVRAFNGFDRDVHLTAVPSAPVLVATIDPDIINTEGTATLTVATSLLTPPGTYTLMINGTDGIETSPAEVRIEVTPFGSVIVGPIPSEDTPIAIPDNNPVGITSTITVPSSIEINELAVQVDITHTFIGDLIVTLTSPGGTALTLHDRGGGGSDDIHEVYNPTAFNGEDSQGDWTLHVQDLAGADTGTLDHWSLTISGLPLDTAPSADFTHAVDGLDVVFTDASSDDGTIVAWAWDFGDGATSAEQHPSHAYAAPGTYSVTLTVTDDLGQTGSVSYDVETQRPTPLLWIERVTRDRDSYEFRVDLGWTGAQGTQVDLHRNDRLWDIPDNDGAYRDRFRHYDTSYRWLLCEQRSDFCSNEVSIVFGAGGDDNELRVVTRRGDDSVVQTLQVEIVEGVDSSADE